MAALRDQHRKSSQHIKQRQAGAGERSCTCQTREGGGERGERGRRTLAPSRCGVGKKEGRGHMCMMVQRRRSRDLGTRPPRASLTPRRGTATGEEAGKRPTCCSLDRVFCGRPGVARGRGRGHGGGWGSLDEREGEQVVAEDGSAANAQRCRSGSSGRVRAV